MTTPYRNCPPAPTAITPLQTAASFPPAAPGLDRKPQTRALRCRQPPPAWHSRALMNILNAPGPQHAITRRYTRVRTYTRVCTGVHMHACTPAPRASTVRQASREPTRVECSPMAPPRALPGEQTRPPRPFCKHPHVPSPGGAPPSSLGGSFPPTGL